MVLIIQCVALIKLTLMSETETICRMMNWLLNVTVVQVESVVEGNFELEYLLLEGCCISVSKFSAIAKNVF